MKNRAHYKVGMALEFDKCESFRPSCPESAIIKEIKSFPNSSGFCLVFENQDDNTSMFDPDYFLAPNSYQIGQIKALLKVANEV